MPSCKTIEDRTWTIKPKNIRIRKNLPTLLEVELLKCGDGIFRIILNLKGEKYSSTQDHMQEYKNESEEQVKKIYGEMIKKIEKGHYVLEIQTDGTFKLL